jgi:catechol 2,3-dioxygenase-like lactoylglutathione lyase family enzyme
MHARIAAQLKARGEGLASVSFRVDDLDRAARRASQVGLGPGAIGAGGEGEETWRTVRLDDAACAGVKTFLIERDGAPPPKDAPAAGAIDGLDHLVIRTPSAERAAAHYGARLGLDMRMDRAAPEWGARMMFFRAGDLIVEVVSLLEPGDAAGDDRLWGLSWRTADLDAAHARLAGAGLDVSEARVGRKPGTRVFTVRDRTVGVPTLVLASAA